MRPTLMIALIIIAGFIFTPSSATTGSKNRDYPHFLKHRTKLREIRGFKPDIISTAIGFGKRESSIDVSDFGKRSRIPQVNNIPHGVIVDMLLYIIQANPVFASKLMQLLMQNSQADEEPLILIEHPKLEKT